MSRITECDGVFFCEGDLEGNVLGSLEVRAATQNTLLSTVKTEVARKAKVLGGNAVIHYSYSQKADQGRNLFKWDQERIVITGTVIQLTQEITLD